MPHNTRAQSHIAGWQWHEPGLCNDLFLFRMLLVAPDDMLAYGLELIGFDEQRQGRVGRKTNLERFGQHYGSTPLVVAALWEKLQTTKRPAARIRVNRRKDLTHFFQALHWMKCYPREGERSGIFKFCEKTCRKWGWHYTTKISQLKDDLVRSFQMFVVLIQCYD